MASGYACAQTAAAEPQPGDGYKNTDERF